MDFRTLTLLWVGLFALRLGFVGLHLRDLDRLWNDYARRGMRFQLARGVDYLTLGVFFVAAVRALRDLGGPIPWRLAVVFAAWLGLSLLQGLPVHRFPRTNVPGGLDEVKLALGVRVLLSALGAVGATFMAAVYFWWRG